MIRRINVDPALEKFVEKYLSLNNIANRGYADGDKEKQKVGMIGEMIVHRLLTGKYPDLHNKKPGFDGGFDLIHNGKYIDVKTLMRRGFAKPNYQNCLYSFQSHYRADLYVFCNYNVEANVLEVCGWVDKADMVIPERFRSAGTKEKRGDGSYFIFRHDDYVINNSELKDITLLCGMAYTK